MMPLHISNELLALIHLDLKPSPNAQPDALRPLLALEVPGVIFVSLLAHITVDCVFRWLVEAGFASCIVVRPLITNWTLVI